ncbi:MAG TPA: hypothetical protein VEF04_00165, partial [Blastocatellia bacterium]|nr:hypothetical protein [Blastocatellia bacterium]
MIANRKAEENSENINRQHQPETKPLLDKRAFKEPSVPVWVGGSFENREKAERAYQLLVERGYNDNEISLVISDETRKRHFAEYKEDENQFGAKAVETTASKAAEEGVKGATIGTVLAFAVNMLVPGMGLLIGGPLFVGIGAMAGGLSGALAERGIPADEAEKFDAEVRQGCILIGVKPHSVEDAEFLE